MTGMCAHPAVEAAPKHGRPSLQAVLPGGMFRRRQRAIAFNRKPAAARSLILCGGRERRFPCRAEINVVHMDRARKRAAVSSLHHCLHDLVLHAPGGVAGDAELAPEIHGRDPLLVLSYEIDPLEPSRERQLGALEQRSGGGRSLPAARAASPQAPVIEAAMLRAPARGHANPFGRRFGALPPGPVVVEEFRWTRPLLELHLISFRHRCRRHVDFRQFYTPNVLQTQ